MCLTLHVANVFVLVEYLMSFITSRQAKYITELINCNNETQAHIYMETILLFPVDVQDKIIEKVSSLPYCNSDEIAKIISEYSTQLFH